MEDVYQGSIHVFEVVTMLSNDITKFLSYLPLFLNGFGSCDSMEAHNFEEEDIFLSGTNHNQYQSWMLWVRVCMKGKLFSSWYTCAT